MKKFDFGAIEWFFLMLFIMRENSLIVDINHQDNFLVAPSNSLKGIAGVSSTSEPISEAAESMISYEPIERENQLKQTNISNEQKAKVHQS